METLRAGDGPPTSVHVTDASSVEVARRMVRAFSLKAGLPATATEQLVLAASELATNLARHSTSGGVMSCSIEDTGRRSVLVECSDTGPGIADLKEARREGFSTQGGLGGGFSTIERMTDEFEIESAPAMTWIRIRKWLP
jgi:serine/threonine-protein kinase RsbT